MRRIEALARPNLACFHSGRVRHMLGHMQRWSEYEYGTDMNLPRVFEDELRGSRCRWCCAAPVFAGGSPSEDQRCSTCWRTAGASWRRPIPSCDIIGDRRETTTDIRRRKATHRRPMDDDRRPADNDGLVLPTIPVIDDRPTTDDGQHRRPLSARGPKGSSEAGGGGGDRRVCSDQRPLCSPRSCRVAGHA